MNDVAKNLERIRREIASRTDRPIEIVGVTKLQPTEKIREAIDAGLTKFGVNYVQAGETLREELKSSPVRWHFIGHIQSRKAKALQTYDCVQSLDRIEIAETLNSALLAVDRKIDCLVEVNIGNEPQKSGVAPEALPAFLKDLAKFTQLRIKGLMGMPPGLENLEERRPFFKRLKSFYDSHSVSYGFDCLSMGTSDDFLIAVEEGCTMVRLGTILFGERPARR